MFREELTRAFWNRSFVIALALGILSLTQGYLEYIDGPSPSGSGYQDYLSRLPPFYNNAYDALIWAQQGLIGLLAPVMAVLPFADSLALDRTRGYLRLVLARVSYGRFLLAKYAAVLLSGGAALALPLVLFFVYTNLVLPRGLNPVVEQQRVLSAPNALGPFGDLYQSAPDMYILGLAGMSFVFGAVYAIFGLAVSAASDNRYIALATPFMVFFLAHFILSALGLPNWSPLSPVVPHWLMNITWLQILLSLGIVLVSSTVFYVAMAGRMRSRI
ncbi:MAG: hypothetical protein OEZ02_07125 [Anaerolineae bacterium]|nr:hypothetical protein [Anaerolineae bacterium]